MGTRSKYPSTVAGQRIHIKARRSRFRSDPQAWRTLVASDRRYRVQANGEWMRV